MLLLVLLGIAIAGLVADLGMVMVHGTRLDQATEAAAVSAVLGCAVPEPDDCRTTVAAQYLQANMPEARLVSATETPQGTLAVKAAADLPRVLAGLWGEPTVLLVSQFEVRIDP